MQANSAAAGDDDDDDLAAIPPPGGLRVGSVCRLVKKSTSKAFNRAASAASDAEFVARFLDLDDHHLDDDDGLSLPSSLPVFANARAGLWHVDLNGPRVQLCRFKSTDGHAAAAGGAGGSFPLSRLNLNVAAAAAAGGGERGGGGGAVIVDATRKGKRFPDALSRTIPIWAAVVNRACRLWVAGKDSSEEEEEEGGRREAVSSFRMPPWVPASERAKVAERIESWARLLLSTGVDLSPFAAEISERPLVPVWIARRGGGGGGEAAGRPAVEVTRAQGDESAATSSTSATTTTTPLYLFSVSDPFARRATVSCGCGSSSGSSSSSSSIGSRSSTSSGETTNRHPSHGCFDHSFDYEPGGGDDEEGWGRGLSARLFWEHRGELLSRGPAGFEEAAEELVRRRRRRREGGSGRDGEEDGRGARARSAGSDASRRPPPASWSFVCGTRLAVGNAAAAAALCREQGLAPAVVILGSGDGGSGAPPSSSSFSSSSNSSSPLCFFRAPVPPRKTKKLGLLEALPSVVAFASAHLARGRTVLLASGGGDSAEDGSGDGENESEDESGNESAAAAAAAVLLACFSPPPRAEFLRAFGGGGVGSGCGDSPPPSRPCGCPAPPRASRDEVRARIAAVCGSATAPAAAAATGGGGGDETSRLSSSPQPLLLLSVGKEAAKQLLMFVSPPERPGGFVCPACRAGRPARVGWERAAAAAALGEKEEQQGKEVHEKTTGASGAEA